MKALTNLLFFLLFAAEVAAQATPASLEFVQQPTSAKAGATISPAVTVRILDVNGRPVNGSTLEIILNFDNNAGGGTLSGTTTVNAVDGIATFGNLSIDKAGNAYRLQAQAQGLKPVASSNFNITAGDPVEIRVFEGNNQTAPKGTAVPIPPRVLVVDQFKNKVSGVHIRFTILEGDGSVAPSTHVTTDTSGTVAVTSWVLSYGLNRLQAARFMPIALDIPQPSIDPVVFQATGTAGPPVSMEIVQGDQQTGFVNSTLPVNPVFRVIDNEQFPVSGVSVQFEIVEGGGQVLPVAAVTTNSEGLASVQSWRLGPAPGNNRLRARITSNASIQAEVTAISEPLPGTGVPTNLTKQDGDNQEAEVETEVPIPPRVRVTDPHGNPVAGVPIRFEIGFGDGSVDPVGPIDTDQNGEAQLNGWRLGPEPGQNTLTVMAEGIDGAATFVANGIARPNGGDGDGDGDGGGDGDDDGGDGGDDGEGGGDDDGGDDGENTSNKAPTMNALPPITIFHSAGEVAIGLSGISAGEGESQTISISARTDDPALISVLSVQYTSPQTTGILRFMNDRTRTGSTVIHVVVRDNGGTADGGVDSLVVSFPVTVLLNTSDEVDAVLPQTFALGQNYPNPFNPSTMIPFSLPERTHVRLDVYDVSGRLVTRLVDHEMAAGTHRTPFNADALSSGLYIVRLNTPFGSKSIRVSLVK